MARTRQTEPEVETVEEETEEQEVKTMRPNELAEELGIDPKRLRAWLRASDFARPAEQKNTNWLLTPDMVEAVKAHFEPEDDETDEEELEELEA